MKKRPGHKSVSSTSHRSKPSSERTVFWYTVIVFSLVLMVFANVGYKLSKPHVLGASTVLLAQGGDDSGGSGSGGGLDSGSGSSGSGSSGGSTSGGSGSQTSGLSTGGSQASVNPSVTVDCVGPDGRHFTTEFHDCQELNQKWGHSSFSFTPLTTQQPESTQETPEVKTHEKIETPQGKLEIETEGNKKKVNLEANGLHIELKSEDDGSVSAVAKREGGKDIKLSAKDALEKLNDQLKDEDVEISSTEGGLAIKKGDVEAQTHFPLSVDPTTGQLTVTTPAGTKTVAVLPDKAVQNLVATGVLSGVVSQGSTTSAGTTQQVQLTDVNGAPAFQVEGVLTKKLLGLFQMSFTKTALVSAEDGHTISVSQSPITSLLEALSF